MIKENRIIKWIAVFMVLLMVAVLIIGCGQNGTGKEPSSSNGEDKATDEPVKIIFPPKENITISIMTPDFARGRDTLVDKEFEKRLNMTFKWSLVPSGDYPQKLSVTLASGDLTDLILLQDGQNILDKYGPQGLFVDLKPYIDSGKMPNYTKWAQIFPELLTDLLDGDGKMYGMENFNTDGMISVGYLYRVDVFEDMGRPLPNTWDELYEALKQFKTENPDSTPISVRWGAGNLIPYFFDAYHTGSGIFLDRDEMKYKFGPIEDGERVKKAVELMTKFYSAGLIDPEFATLADAQFKERIITGRAIAWVAEYILQNNDNHELGRQIDPDFSIRAALPPKNEYGERAGLWVQYAAQPSWVKAINANTEADKDLLVALLDYTVSDEAIELANWGIEGVTFTRDTNGKKTLDPKYKTRANPGGTINPSEDGLDGRSLFWCPIDNEKDRVEGNPHYEDQVMYHAHADEFAIYELLVPPMFTDKERDYIAQTWTPIGTFIDEQVIRFMTGELSIENDWDNFIEKVNAMEGWKELVDLYNKKLEEIPEEQRVLKTRFRR